MLDSERVMLALACYANQVCALAVIELEFPLEESEVDAVFWGERRLRGNLITQSMVFHNAEKSFAKLRVARISRIVCTEPLRRHHIGSRLVQYTANVMQADGIDVLGAAFGLEKHLQKFWQQLNFYPAREGHAQDARSGRHTLFMLRGLTDAGVKIVEQLRQQFKTDQSWLALHPVVLTELKDSEAKKIDLNEHDSRLLHSFARGNLPLDSAKPALIKFGYAILSEQVRGSKMSVKDSLFYRFLTETGQLKELASTCGMPGKKAALKALRKEIAILLKAADFNCWHDAVDV
jgi:tRNA(Met) cytidine acetyltransferase